ncbi:MAG: VOC family protein [Deltaproteobacteria bacterium]|nr:VOC family protein [Deltaproteobacteria bacterium]
MDRAIKFYTDTLGLKLRNRFGNEWADIDAGEGFKIGLHPANEANRTKAGVTGSTVVGLAVSGPIEQEIATLKSRGVAFTGHIQLDPNAPVKIAYFADQDGNSLYLCETNFK